MDVTWKKKLLAGGMVAALTFGGLAGCADGKDQDNGIDDGEQEDQLDTDDNVNDGVDQDNQLDEDSGINDGIDQDNGIDNGKVDDQIDPENDPMEKNEQ